MCILAQATATGSPPDACPGSERGMHAPPSVDSPPYTNGHASDVVIAEGEIGYDGGHFTRIDDDALDEILATCHPPAVSVYLFLARRANANGVCWPSLDGIVDGTTMPRTTVKRAIAELEKRGWVGRRDRVSRFGTTLTSEYLLLREYPRTYRGSKPRPNRDQTVTKAPSILDPKEDTKNTKRTPKEETLLSGPPEYPDDMMVFWKAYDAKGRDRSSRDQVLAEWKKIRKVDVPMVMASVAAWRGTASWRDGFALGAHRFLKTGKWRETPAMPTLKRDV